MVKNDRQGIQFAWISYSIVALLYGALFLVSNSFENNNPSDFLFAAYWLALAILYYGRAQRWKPMNERRQMAAYWGFAAHVPLAQPQPLPNVAALPLPFIITLKPNWPKFLLGLGFLVGAALLSLAIIFPLIEEHGILDMEPFALVFTLFMLLGVSIPTLLWLRPQRIAVTQEGLLVRHLTGGIHGTDWIRWNDARLIAIRDGKPGSPATRYELSSPYAVVQWTRAQPHRWSLHRPAIAYAEYNAQMDALIALISG